MSTVRNPPKPEKVMVYKTPAGWVTQCPCQVIPCESWDDAMAAARFKALAHRSPLAAIIAVAVGIQP